MIDSSEKLTNYDKSEVPFIAGHDLIELTYKYRFETRTKRTITRRCLKQFNSTNFIESVASFLNTSSSDCDLTSDINYFSSHLSAAILTSLNLHAPFVSFDVSKPRAKWLTDELRLRIVKKNSLYRQARRSGNLLSIEIYRGFRNKLTSDLRQARNDYHYERLNGIRDSAHLWKELRVLGIVKPETASCGNYFSLDELNEYFSSISNATEPCDYDSFVRNIKPLDTEHPIFDFTPVTADCLSSIISSSLSPSHSAGPDNISSFAILNSLPTIAPLLVNLFNLSFEKSQFPSCWKRAHIRPLLKANPPTSLSDCRPIANLSELSKLFERIIHKQITNYLSHHNLMDPRQSGFRRGFSTQAALLRICQDVCQAVDAREITILILFDFSKAFDLVSHSKLLIELRSFGFCDGVLRWFFFIFNRTVSGCGGWLRLVL